MDSCIIKQGKIQYEYKQSAKHIVGKRLTLNQLKQIPAGYGGRIGVIPWCTVDINKYYILCNIYWQGRGSSGNVVGDLGGGIKRTERPYDALYNELREEVPSWYDILKSQIENTPIEIYSIEYINAIHGSLRYAITIFVDITPFVKVLNDIFRPTKEIKSIMAYSNIVQCLMVVKNLNYGLLYYRDYLEYQMHSQLFRPLELLKPVDIMKAREYLIQAERIQQEARIRELQRIRQAEYIKQAERIRQSNYLKAMLFTV